MISYIISPVKYFFVSFIMGLLPLNLALDGGKSNKYYLPLDGKDFVVSSVERLRWG